MVSSTRGTPSGIWGRGGHHLASGEEGASANDDVIAVTSAGRPRASHFFRSVLLVRESAVGCRAVWCVCVCVERERREERQTRPPRSSLVCGCFE